jgi:hypothetical protein
VIVVDASVVASALGGDGLDASGRAPVSAASGSSRPS